MLIINLTCNIRILTIDVGAGLFRLLVRSKACPQTRPYINHG